MSVASKLCDLIKRGELVKIQDLLGPITDPAVIRQIENAFEDTDPVNLAINCRFEELAIYLVEKGFCVTKLYQSPSQRCDQWCRSKHRQGRCPAQFDAADNAASKHFHRLKELIQVIQAGQRQPGEGLTEFCSQAAKYMPQPPSEKKPRTDRLFPPGVKKEKPKSAANEALAMLERHGANYVDAHGNTLLHCVAKSTPAHIYVLANRGVPVNVQNTAGDTALHIAVRFDNFDAAEALIQCSADLSVMNEMFQTPVDEAKGPMREMLEKFRPDPVQCVLVGNSSKLLKHLRKNWCSVQSVVKDGKNLIQLAMSHVDEKPEIMKCCQILQEYRNTSELIHAVLSEDVSKLKQFLEQNRNYAVNWRFRDKDGKTLLSHAIDSNNYEIVELLVMAGARVNQIRVRDKGRSKATVPLFFKALRSDINPDIVQYLLSVQDAAEILEKDSNGNTALLRAVEEGASEQVISWLLQAQNLSITHRNKDSLNARELAMSQGRSDIVSAIDRFVMQQRKKFFLVNLPVRFYGMENLQFLDETGKPFTEVVLEGQDREDWKSISHYEKIEKMAIKVFEAAAKGELGMVAKHSLGNFQDKNGFTALTRAIVFNQQHVVEYLCTSRPILKSIPDNCNRYPLHYACSLPDEQAQTLKKILLGSHPEHIDNKMDKDGRRAADYSLMRGTFESQQLLYDARTLDAYGSRYSKEKAPWLEGATAKPPQSEE